jgi:5-methylcytosine-specific restriction endonuclease McrA
MPYDRHSIAPVEEVLDHVRRHLTVRDRRARVEINGQLVKVTSLRLRTFAIKGVVCVRCGAVGTFFALERNLADAAAGKLFHLNLYTADEMLLTHDHILARSLGGPDHIDNTQPMCRRCNTEKGEIEQRIGRSRRLGRSEDGDPTDPLLQKSFLDPSARAKTVL